MPVVIGRFFNVVGPRQLARTDGFASLHRRCHLESTAGGFTMTDCSNDALPMLRM